jgi:hypothetical protein
MPGATVTITGVPRVGEELRGGPSATDWNPSRASLRYDWYVGTTLVLSGSERDFPVTPGAVGKAVTLVVTATKDGYETTVRRSASTKPVTRGVLRAGTPRISGTSAVGQVLRAETGVWGPSPVKLGYRWKIGRTLVSGAAGKRPTLRLPRTARGKRVTLVVTGTKAGYTTASRSASTGPVR